MSVSSVSSGIGLNQADWRSTVKQGKQDFSQLLGALQSGDVSGAQQAYAAMQQLLPGMESSTPAAANSVNSASSGSVATNTIDTDFSTLGTALSSGSLSGAQDAVAKLQQDSQAYRQGAHQFGSPEHAEDVYKSMQQGSTGSSSSSNPVTASSSTNSLNTDLNALGQALQSGSLSSAQDAFAKFKQDLQSAQQGRGAGHHHHHYATSGAQNPISSYIANSVLGSTSATVGSASSSVKVSV